MNSAFNPDDYRGFAGVFSPPRALETPWGTPVAHWQPDLSLSPTAQHVVERLSAAGGRVMMVGGWVRDGLWGESPGDEDLEVFGLSPEAVQAALSPTPVPVGADFGILKYRSLDISFPRRLGASQRGKAGLAGDVYPQSTLKEAALRRDFTLNALAWAPQSGHLYDPAGGLADMRAGVLRVVDRHHFAQDSVRLLRAMQFAARFELKIEEALWQWGPSLLPALKAQPQERLYEALIKLLSRGKTFGHAFEFAQVLGIFEALWPGVFDLSPQDWQGLARVLAEFHDPARSKRVEGQEGALILLWHRLPKGRRDEFLHALTRSRAIQRRVPVYGAALERLLAKKALSDGDLGALARRVRFAQLFPLLEALLRCEAAPHWGYFEALKARVEGLKLLDGPHPPYFTGQDLIALGLRPGPAMGQLLERLYRWQLDGWIGSREDGILRLRRLGLIPKIQSSP